MSIEAHTRWLEFQGLLASAIDKFSVLREAGDQPSTSKSWERAYHKAFKVTFRASIPPPSVFDVRLDVCRYSQTYGASSKNIGAAHALRKFDLT